MARECDCGLWEAHGKRCLVCPVKGEERRPFDASSEAQARADAVELADFIRDLVLTRDEMVELFTAVLLGFSGKLDAGQVERRVAGVAEQAMKRR